MQDLSAFLTAACGAVPLDAGLVLGLFLAGLAGSPMHCGPMCGGFVLGQVADRLAVMPAGRMCEWHRIGAAALLPYHAGRMLTYAGLGAVAGLGGMALTRVPYLSTVLLLVAAFGILGMARRRWRRPVARSVPERGVRGSRTPSGPRALIGGLAARFRSGFPLGVLLGFLPCGFLYTALIAAAAGQDPFFAALGMAAFAAGTAPALIAVGVAGHAAGHRWRAAIASFAPFVLVLNAALLALLAIRSLPA